MALQRHNRRDRATPRVTQCGDIEQTQRKEPIGYGGRFLLSGSSSSSPFCSCSSSSPLLFLLMSAFPVRLRTLPRRWDRNRFGLAFTIDRISHHSELRYCDDRYHDCRNIFEQCRRQVCPESLSQAPTGSRTTQRADHGPDRTREQSSCQRACPRAYRGAHQTPTTLRLAVCGSLSLINSPIASPVKMIGVYLNPIKANGVSDAQGVPRGPPNL